LHVIKKAWKNLVNCSSNYSDNFIWVSLEMALDQQTLEESQKQSVGNDSLEDEF
jgi:hypothetical protein